MNLDKQYAQAKALYDSALAQWGPRSGRTELRAQDLEKIARRILRRNMRKGKAA